MALLTAVIPWRSQDRYEGNSFKPCPVFEMDLCSNETVKMLADRCLRSYEHLLTDDTLRKNLKFAMLRSDGGPHYAFRILQAKFPRYRQVRFFCARLGACR